MKIKDAKVLVFGTGISGIGATNLLLEQGARVVLYDGNENCDKEQIFINAGRRNFEIILGILEQEIIVSLDLVVLSPGVPTDLEVVNRMRELNIPIWGEIELAYTFERGQVMALTGTNGKTTTTALLGAIMKAYQEEVFVVGNIGTPYTNTVQHTSRNSVSVAELSSFQLETVHNFTPRITGILNLTPDHLNRHHTMDAYVEAKYNIAKKQTKDHTCVLNHEDHRLREFGHKCNANVIYFSSKQKLEKGMYLNEKEIIYADTNSLLCTIDELKLLGIHNYENVMMASLMALAYGVPMETIKAVICQYEGVEHRIEFVCEKEGVTFYNDSKATNCDAAIKGIEAMVRPTILIAGGYDKDGDYSDWLKSCVGKVKVLILTGETKEKIGRDAQKYGIDNIVYEDNFDQAVNISKELAKKGDAVLLSPACASWGQFKNYEERGDKFKVIIKS